MSLPNSSAQVDSLLRLRVAVAFLGERRNRKWWDTDFLSEVGRQYFQLIFPRTALQASIHSASAAALKFHDERIGVGRVFHLFRMDYDTEFRLHRLALEIDPAQLTSLLETGAAIAHLKATAQKVTPSPGPINVGRKEDALKMNSISKLAGYYLAATQSDQLALPYFA
jgi:hypothetical protein